MSDYDMMGYESGEQAYVVVMPGRLGGSPTIGHRRLNTEMIADLYWEYGMDEPTEGYDLTPGEVVTAVWFEARYGTRSRRQRWKGWLDANQSQLWSPSMYGAPTRPPTKENP